MQKYFIIQSSFPSFISNYDLIALMASFIGSERNFIFPIEFMNWQKKHLN